MGHTQPKHELEASMRGQAGGQTAGGGFALAIHGGWSPTPPPDLTPEMEAGYLNALTESLVAGYQALATTGSSLDAVVAAICVMEDCPLFNAGRGAVFTSDGHNELDASIMDGSNRRAGAVAAVTTVKNPILAARAVMERSRHVLLVGRGAEAFAEEQRVELVEPGYFFTQRRWEQLQRAKEREAEAPCPAHATRPGGPAGADLDLRSGTVGAVALDANGNLAAGTSTGGTTNKRWGRVGDSPLVGAGVYADNRTIAASGTGIGEAFIRAVALHDIAALMEYRGMSLQVAADEVIRKKIPALGGGGGAIVLDGRGHHAFSFTDEVMYRGVIRDDRVPWVAIHR
jgi:beta-aspartyl-peptidase (threonine type)